MGNKTSKVVKQSVTTSQRKLDANLKNLETSNSRNLSRGEKASHPSPTLHKEPVENSFSKPVSQKQLQDEREMHKKMLQKMNDVVYKPPSLLEKNLQTFVPSNPLLDVTLARKNQPEQTVGVFSTHVLDAVLKGYRNGLSTQQLAQDFSLNASDVEILVKYVNNFEVSNAMNQELMDAVWAKGVVHPE